MAFFQIFWWVVRSRFLRRTLVFIVPLLVQAAKLLWRSRRGWRKVTRLGR